VAIDKCAVCGATDHDFFCGKNGHTIVRCNRCGTGRVSPMPSPEDIVAIYRDDYFSDEKRSGYDGTYLLEEDISRTEARKYLRNIPGASRNVLEIGCAYGFFLDEARKYGHRVRGIELDPTAVAYCRNTQGLPVSECSIENFDPGGDLYDLIVMLDVIEHLRHPDAVLGKVNSLLREDGLLLARVPDFGSRIAQTQIEHWDKMRPPAHLWYYTTDSFRALLAEFGFEPRKVLHEGGSGLCTSGTTAGPVMSLVRKAGPALGPLKTLAGFIARMRGNLDNLVVVARKRERK